MGKKPLGQPVNQAQKLEVDIFEGFFFTTPTQKKTSYKHQFHSVPTRFTWLNIKTKNVCVALLVQMTSLDKITCIKSVGWRREAPKFCFRQMRSVTKGYMQSQLKFEQIPNNKTKNQMNYEQTSDYFVQKFNF